MQKTIQLSLISVALLSQLQAKEVTLNEVTVTTATKSTQSIKDVTSNTVVITSEELEEKHFTTVGEALKSVAGIDVISNGGIGSTSSLQLRGMGNNRTLILIDGVRYQDPSSTSGGNISHLLTDDIEKIEIIKGAQSGIWGADASAGVINIITKSAKEGTHARANVEYGSFKTIKYNASLSHKSGALEVKLSASKITSDSFSVQSPKDDDVSKYEDDPYENTTINFKAAYAITDDAKIKFDITSINSLKDYDSYGNPDDDTMRSDANNLLYSFGYFQKISNHDISLRYENSDFARDEIGTVAQYGTEYVKSFNGSTDNIELNDNFKYMEDSFFLFGGGMRSDDVEYTLTDDSTKDKTNKSNYLYATNSNKFASLIFTQSLRYDYYDNFDNKLTGKIGAKYNLSNELYLTSNIGTGYNVPNIVQELNPWGGVNEDLSPENTISFDVSVGYKSLEITYFHQKIEDLIEWYDPDGWGGNPAIYKNLDGESTFKGVEISYKDSFFDELYLNTNYTYLSAKDKDEKDLARRAKHSLNLSLNYYVLDTLQLGINAKYIGQRYDSADKQGEETGKYTVANFVTNYTANDYLDIYLKIDNISDTKYQEIDGYATAERSYYIGLNARY